MLKTILNKFEDEGILFNIVKDDEVTIVTNSRVVVTDMDGSILEERENENTKDMQNEVEELLNKIKSEEIVI